MRKQLEEFQKLKELEDKKKEIKQLIPKELFILNGKFDEIGLDKEVEKRVNEGWTAEAITEYYNTKLELLKMGGLVGKPYGASNSTGSCSKKYETPSSVPEGELKGASDNFDSSQFTALKNICKMFGINGGGA